MVKSKYVVFPEPKQVEIREEEITDPGPGEVLCQAEKSLISIGTELNCLNGIFEDLHAVPGEREVELVRVLSAECPEFEFVTIEYYEDPDAVVEAYQSFSHMLGPRSPLA